MVRRFLGFHQPQPNYPWFSLGFVVTLPTGPLCQATALPPQGLALIVHGISNDAK
jgi:hypothetical protein